MSTGQGSDNGVPITYEKIMERDGYVTGVASHDDPETGGRFRIYVSGPPEAVQGYAESAQIMTMRLREGEVDERDARRSALARWRKRLERQQDALARLEALYAAEALDRAAEAALLAQIREGQQTHACCAPDLRRDRLIEIEPLEPIERGRSYTLRVTIDPFVSYGCTDAYQLRAPYATSAAGRLISGVDQVDLELRCYSTPVDSATGTDTDVSWSSGPSMWALYVYGVQGGNYDIDQLWQWDLVRDE